MLFSEPKIPQFGHPASISVTRATFQCSSASRKFLNSAASRTDAQRPRVSVLFSEPKIPQSRYKRCRRSIRSSFSALQRAENSSIILTSRRPISSISFSALQRAENSSIDMVHTHLAVRSLFQCSSASRKFLNPTTRPRGWTIWRVSVLFSEPKIPQSNGGRSEGRIGSRFSALQRAENSSMSRLDKRCAIRMPFQCSSASRKFLNSLAIPSRTQFDVVSVLFSEPKIPQSGARRLSRPRSVSSFSALQRAENSSMPIRACTIAY